MKLQSIVDMFPELPRTLFSIWFVFHSKPYTMADTLSTILQILNEESRKEQERLMGMINAEGNSTKQQLLLAQMNGVSEYALKVDNKIKSYRAANILQ